MTSAPGKRPERSGALVGRAALIASVVGQRGWADWAKVPVGFTSFPGEIFPGPAQLG